MANELQFYGDPASDSGATIVARVYSSTGAQVGSDITTTEVGSLAIYQGDMPTAPAGTFGVRFFDGATLMAQGSIDWDGAKEVTEQTLTALAVLNQTETISEINANEAKVDAMVVTLGDVPQSVWEYNIASIATEGQAGKELLDAQVVADLTGIATATDVVNARNSVQADISGLNNISMSDVATEVAGGFSDYDGPTKSELDAAQATIVAAIDDLNDLSISNIETAISNQEPISANITQVAGVAVSSIDDFNDVLTEGEFHTFLDNYTGKDGFKADVSGIDLSSVITEVNANEVKLDSIISSLSGGGGGSLTAADVWDYLGTSATAPGSLGELIIRNLDAPVSTAVGGGSPDSPVMYYDYDPVLNRWIPIYEEA